MKRVMIAALAAAFAIPGCTSSGQSDTSASSGASSVSTASIASATSAPGTAASGVTTDSAVAPSVASPVPTDGASSVPAAGTVVTIAFAAGKVKTDAKVVKIKRGSTVTVVVTSDVADEVHVHGYDIKQDVEAGATVRIPLTATDTGVFEIELEKSAALLVKLQIQ